MAARDEQKGEKFEIGDLAEEFDISHRTLRFYEDRGFLKPDRRGTMRIYSQKDRDRLKRILLFKKLGFSLLEASQLIERYDRPNGKRRDLVAIRKRLSEQQLFLKQQSDDLLDALRLMDQTIASFDAKISGDNDERMDAMPRY